MLEQLTSTGKNTMNIDLNFTPHTEINSKHIMVLSVTHKTWRKKVRNLQDLGVNEKFSDLTLKAWTIKGKKIINRTSSKLKSFALPKILFREWKDELQTRRKYLQTTYSTRLLYTKYISNSQYSAVEEKCQSN